MGQNSPRAGGRVNRTVFVYRPENFDQAVRQFEAALGMDFGERFDKDGLREVVAWDHGLEIISPIGQEGFAPAIADYLRTHGEGFFGFVYEVDDDLEAAEDRAAASGHPRLYERVDCLRVNPAWSDRFESAVESVLQPIAGIGVTLIKLDRR